MAFPFKTRYFLRCFEEVLCVHLCACVYIHACSGLCTSVNVYVRENRQAFTRSYMQRTPQVQELV